MVLQSLEDVQQLMSAIDQKVNHVFSGGDPIMGEWFLIGENYLPFLLTVCYLLFCTLIGPSLMRNRKPFDLRGPMIVFNFFLVAIYVGGFTTTMIYFPKVTWEEFCNHSVVRKGHYTYTLACMAWLAYVVKYVEYFDTVFFVLRKKMNQMSFLHLLHHTIVPLLGWFLIRTEASGILSIPTMINGFVHIIMYSYYGLSAMGPQVQKYLWWKKYLTKMQMVQFVTIILYVALTTLVMGCRIPMINFFVCIGIASIFLYLFYQFYKLTFRQKKD